MARSAASVQSLTLSDGRSLCVRRWRGPGRHTVVFLHGLLDSSEGWTQLCDQMDCRRIAFDLPGFGYSDAPPEGSITGYARDLAEGIEALGLKGFTLVGHSLGGAVAAALAELMPDRVTALVLLAPAGFGRIHLAEAVSIPGVRNLVQAALPFALTSSLAVTAGYMTMVTNGIAPEQRLVDRVTSRGKALVDGAREGTRAVVEAGRSRGAFHRRRVGYAGPVFAVWGEHDRLVPVSHRRGVLTAFPHAHIDLWQGMGHHPARERFDDLLALIGSAVSAGRAASAATRRAARAAPPAAPGPRRRPPAPPEPKGEDMDDSRDLAQETWPEYFDALSRELLNAPVSIEIEGITEGRAVEAERLALQLLVYDRRSDVFEVAVARGGPHLPSVVRHLVDHPTRIAVDSRTMLAPMTIAVDGDDGTRTVIRVGRDAEISS